MSHKKSINHQAICAGNHATIIRTEPSGLLRRYVSLPKHHESEYRKAAQSAKSIFENWLHIWGTNYSLLALVQLSQLSRVLSARHATSTIRHIAFLFGSNGSQWLADHSSVDPSHRYRSRLSSRED